MVSNYGSWLQYSSQSCADTNMRPKTQSSFKSDFFNPFSSVTADLELRRGQTSDKRRVRLTLTDEINSNFILILLLVIIGLFQIDFRAHRRYPDSNTLYGAIVVEYTAFVNKCYDSIRYFCINVLDHQSFI